MVPAIAGPNACDPEGWWKQDWNPHLGRGLTLLVRQHLRGQLETPGLPLAFRSFNLTSLLVRQLCCSMKIVGLPLPDFWSFLNHRGKKSHSGRWRGFTEALAQDVTHSQINYVIYVAVRIKSLQITLYVISKFKESFLDHITIYFGHSSFYFPSVLQTPKN